MTTTPDLSITDRKQLDASTDAASEPKQALVDATSRDLNVSSSNLRNFNPRRLPEPAVSKPPSAHQVAFAIQRSPIMGLLEEAICDLNIAKRAKIAKLAEAEHMFTDLVVLGRGSRTNLHPIVRLLEAFGFRELQVADGDTKMTGTKPKPSGEPFTVALPPGPRCSAAND